MCISTRERARFSRRVRAVRSAFSLVRSPCGRHRSIDGGARRSRTPRDAVRAALQRRVDMYVCARAHVDRHRARSRVRHRMPSLSFACGERVTRL